MKKEEIAELAVAELEKLYPDAACSLNYSKPYELMFAARLSAQCTDARVNIVTETLFKKYPTLQSFADADLEELQQDIKPCGFYKTKAKSIKEMANQLINNFNGEIPQTIDELLTLSGIGRKTAKLIPSPNSISRQPPANFPILCRMVSPFREITRNRRYRPVPARHIYVKYTL